MIKLTNYSLYKCKQKNFSTYEYLCIITGKNTLEELKNLDYTPYIDTKDLCRISKVNIDSYKGMPAICLKNKVTGRSLELNLNNFYYAACTNTECKNYIICN